MGVHWEGEWWRATGGDWRVKGCKREGNNVNKCVRYYRKTGNDSVVVGGWVVGWLVRDRKGNKKRNMY